MGFFRKSAAMAIGLVLLLAFRAEVVVSGEPSSSAAARQLAVHGVRKMLNTTAGGDGDPRGAGAASAAASYAAERMVSPDDCSEEVVQVSQQSGGFLPDGIPSYSVTITNTCLACTVSEVHVSCGEFASTVLVDPGDFQRLAYGDCLVNGGGPMGPGDTVSFEYANSFQYPMDVASVSCGGNS
ncbi:hypothetical protein ACP70R_020852 [Stipagrostis hirtigluma subsp. patula]